MNYHWIDWHVPSNESCITIRLHCHDKKSPGLGSSAAVYVHSVLRAIFDFLFFELIKLIVGVIARLVVHVFLSPPPVAPKARHFRTSERGRGTGRWNLLVLLVFLGSILPVMPSTIVTTPLLIWQSRIKYSTNCTIIRLVSHMCKYACHHDGRGT